MKFEELTEIWNSTDMELDKSLKINRQLVKNIGIKKLRSGFYEMKFTAVVGIVVGVFFLMFLWRFMIFNYQDIKFFLPALILAITAAFGLIIEIYKLTLIYTLDPTAPVTDARKKLVSLQKIEILTTYSLFVIIPLFTAPFLIVTCKAFFNLNLYEFNTNWLIYLTGGSIVIAAILIFFLRKFPGKELSGSLAFLKDLKE